MGDLATGYILGQIAEGYFKGMEETAVAVMSPRSATPQHIDVSALLAEIQALRNHNALLQDDIARLGRNVEKLSTWGDGLYAELVKIKGR